VQRLGSGGKDRTARCWQLIVTRQPGDAKTLKYSLANASETLTLQRLAYMQRQRYWVERAFQEAKTEAGLGSCSSKMRTWRSVSPKSSEEFLSETHETTRLQTARAPLSPPKCLFSFKNQLRLSADISSKHRLELEQQVELHDQLIGKPA